MIETVFISGANRGLGLALTKHFLRAGFQVFAGIRSTSSGIETLLVEFPKTLTVISLDVAEMASIQQAAADVAAKTSALGVLINNAAIYPAAANATLENLDLSDGHLEKIMTVNAFGPLRLTQQLLPLLEAGARKTVINISSEAGSIADCWRAGEYAYCMSKTALNMQTRLLHNALQPKGFKVLALHPGWMQTDMGGPNAPTPAEQSAEGIFQRVMEDKTPNENIYLDYQGNVLRW